MISWGNEKEPVESWPSAEDEYFASLEPKLTYTFELFLALAELTEKQRFVVECRYGLRGGREMTVCEIATLMGVSHVSIVKLLQRAMNRMRKGLQDLPI